MDLTEPPNHYCPHCGEQHGDDECLAGLGATDADLIAEQRFAAVERASLRMMIERLTTRVSNLEARARQQ